MTQTAPAPSAVQRLLSLDVLRGITIAFMIMVNNNGGDGAWGFMKHAQWNGLTATDLVFPTFVFVVGASVVFAFEARLARGATRGELVRHTLQRFVILFLLGVVVNSFPFFELPHMRFYGVLQRIAVAYLAVSLFYLWDRRSWTKAAALVAALVGYWVLLRWCPIPGVGTPGRDFPFMDERLNLTSWIDRGLMPGHLYLDWGGPNAHNVRDPEGLLSDLPAIGTALMGMLAALWLRSDRSVSAKAKGLGAGAVVSLILGYLWSLEFPLNKNLWTNSFVLVAGGWSLVVLTLSYWFVEKWGWGKQHNKWTVYPWLVFGSNAIAAYMFSELMPGILWNIHFSDAGKRTDALGWVFRHVYANIPDPGWAAFGYSASFCAVCFLPVWILYRKKIFIKV
ncbi:MAG: heparan-alpha-glucosaminide N-acetyltransferase domain-containing protein [Terracidiphilus sp.]